MGDPEHAYRLGDVVEVTFPDTIKSSFLGMVTRLRPPADMFLTDIKLGVKVLPPPAEQVWETLWVSRESAGKRHVLHLRPEFEAWRSGAPMCFGSEQPEIPTGLSLQDLLYYRDGMFILADDPPTDGPNTATFNRPFFDHSQKSVVQQHVTVFALNRGDQLVRRHADDHSGRWRHLLPAGCSFMKVDAGPVLTCQERHLALGDNLMPGGKLRWHPLFRNQLFAVETTVLLRAGIDPETL